MLDLEAIFNPEATNATQTVVAAERRSASEKPNGPSVTPPEETTGKPETEVLADAIAFVVRRLRERGQPIREIVLTTAEAEPLTSGGPRDLTDILPSPSWLTPQQRRLWRERTEFYERNTGLARNAAEQEAMAELVMTGKLCDQTWSTIGR